VLVVTPSDATARWASQPIDLGGGTWRALVVGPEGIPVVTDIERATREPHLAILSILAHGRDDDVPTAVAIATAATAGAAGLPDPIRVLCLALIESSLGEAARKTFAMLPQGQRFFSETMRRAYAEGEAKGSIEAEAKATARAILTVLDARQVQLSAEQRERILAFPDVLTLNDLLKRAATIETADQLFVR
jgi:hypothetical protein